MKETKTNIRVATWNLGRNPGYKGGWSDGDIVEATNWLLRCAGAHAYGFPWIQQVRTLLVKDCKFKFFCAQAGMMLAENSADKVIEVQRISDRIILLKLIIGKVFSPSYQCTHLMWTELVLKRNVSTTSCSALFSRSQPLRYLSQLVTGTLTLVLLPVSTAMPMVDTASVPVTRKLRESWNSI